MSIDGVVRVRKRLEVRRRWFSLHVGGRLVYTGSRRHRRNDPGEKINAEKRQGVFPRFFFFTLVFQLTAFWKTQLNQGFIGSTRRAKAIASDLVF